MLHHDVHGFVRSSPLYNKNKVPSDNIIDLKIADKLYEINIDDRRLNECNLFVSPTILFFKNIKSKYTEKTEFIPFSYNSNNQKIFELQDFDNYFNRERKILMSGTANVYSHRQIIVFLKQNIEPSYLQDRVINLD